MTTLKKIQEATKTDATIARIKKEIAPEFNRCAKTQAHRLAIAQWIADAARQTASAIDNKSTITTDEIARQTQPNPRTSGLGDLAIAAMRPSIMRLIAAWTYVTMKK